MGNPAMAIVNILSKLSIATAGAVVVALEVGGTAQASSGYTGAYDFPEEISIERNNIDNYYELFVEAFFRGESLLFDLGITAETYTALATGLVSFDWFYISMNHRGAFSDRFGFLLNNELIQLSDLGPFGPQEGSFSALVNKGDIFGFAIETVDRVSAPSFAVISNLHAPQPISQTVPEPTSLIAILGLGAFGITSLCKRKQQAAAKLI